MTLVLTDEEKTVWDQFASAALPSVLVSRPINGNDAASISAKIADALILERRERVTGKKSVPLRDTL